MRFMRSQTSFGILISELISVEKLTYKKGMIFLVLMFSSNISETRATLVFRRRGIRVNRKRREDRLARSTLLALWSRYATPSTVNIPTACIPTIPLSSLSVSRMKAYCTKYGGFSSMHVNQHVAKADPIICFSKACRSKLTRFREEFSSFS